MRSCTMSTFAHYKKFKSPLPKVYGLDEIELAVSDEKAVMHAMADGFKALSEGKVSVPPIQTMGQEPCAAFVAGGGTQTCVKSGYIDGDDYYVTKVATGGFMGNARDGMSPNTGCMLIYSQRTGRLEAILLDEGLLTEIRTAAAGALASSLLAPKDVRCIGILGSGVQARWQLRFLKNVTATRKVLVFALDRLEEFRDEMAAEGWEVAIADSIEHMVRGSDLVHTVTTARAPLVKREWVSKGMHITNIGADAPGKQEMDPQIMAQADLLVTDSRAQTAERGEFQHALEAGLVGAGDIVEIGELLGRPELHRQGAHDDRLTVFDTSGVAVEDESVHGGFRLVATKPIRAHDALAMTPRKLWLEPGRLDDIPAASVLTPEERLSLVLLREKRHGEASPWKHYIRLLPLSLPTMLYFRKKALAELEGTYTHALAVHAQSSFDEYYARAQRALAGSPLADVTRKELRWAYSQVLARGFAMPKTMMHFLSPGAALINHSEEAKTRWYFPGQRIAAGPRAGAVAFNGHTVTTKSAHPAGVEVFNSYREGLPNHSLLSHFGFAVENNPFDSIVLRFDIPQADPERKLKRRLFLRAKLTVDNHLRPALRRRSD
eukprot:g7507.t1